MSSTSRSKLSLAILATCLLASCVDGEPQSPAQLKKSSAIFDYEMVPVPEFAKFEDAKAMAACIRWADGKEKLG